MVIKIPLKVLIIEDSEDDTDLLLRQLRRGAYQVTHARVDTQASLQETLEQDDWDIIISDYTMPEFNALDALKVVQNQHLNIPFIIVSGTIGEETAVAAMKAGAQDYLLKGNLARLLPAIAREVREAEDRRKYQFAEKALEFSEERFKTLCASAPLGIFQCDTEGQNVYVNPLWEKISGLSPEESRADGWINAIHPEDRQCILESWKCTISQQECWVSEHRLLTSTGQTRWVRTLANPMLSSQGQFSGYVGTVEDITEKRNLEAQFLRAQRLESLGTLASGIAHDFNNILTPILAGIQMLPSRLPNLDNRSLKFLKMIEDSALRGANLVKQILSFAQGIEGKNSTIDINHIILEIINILQETFPKAIKVNKNLSKTLWLISADATQLHQVLMNLCINARDAMPQGGILSITTENYILECNDVQEDRELKAGFYLLVSISDTGTGIKPETLDRIFDPFFTTKPIGKGTGLGLSTVLGIVRKHGGFIKVNSQLGQGSNFQIFLPALEEIAVQDKESSSSPLGNGELILVVDDEISIRQVTQSLLEHKNFRVLTANNGLKATSIYKQHQADIDLVLLDIMMPGMDGILTIRMLRKINPSLKIIVMSGLIADKEKIEEKGLSVNALLTKPYSTQELLSTIHQVLQD